MLFLKIQQLKEKKFKVAQIAAELKISRPTVYKYLEMDFEEVREYISNPHRKAKKLDPYRDWIVAWLEEYPHLSAAQIQDRLLERYPDLSIGESTVRLYVSEIREIYQIEKKAVVRHYEAVPEQPMGKQLQVDWGETKQRTTAKKEVKLYFIAFVLAHSRYKYMEWQDRPFTTRDAIRCHENAFRFYGGRPEEIVYDQDHLLTVSENAGDLLLTAEFQAYVKERKFKIHLCRKADPESKGMIENVVKYIKGNFADSRVFSEIKDWNRRAWQWLERTGNKNVHHTTKKRPVAVFLVEKQHLQPVSPLLSNESTDAPSITRNVGKDNTIRYRSNRYTVPTGTYGSLPENRVMIEVKGKKPGTLLIRKPQGREIIAEHPISMEKGKLIRNRNHTRDRSKGIESAKKEVIYSFTDSESAAVYVDELCQRYPRYRRDQLAILQKAILEESEWVDEALRKCVAEQLYSANDFRDVVSHLKSMDAELDRPVHEHLTVQPARPDISVNIRPLDAYTRILEGHAI
ncbi:IS21 family transposase [Planococcus lenghuensis]|uniref:IS21 family transposase n=1 Tax=Planococcus lenghuensis TaxID=2213202 RepID=UPI0012EC4349|nr:IS21 family transposase [Planococcus lenghuensis]